MEFKIFMFLFFLPCTITYDIYDLFPKEAIPKTFQLEIQSTVSKGVTTLSREYYDGVKDSGTIITFSSTGKNQETFKKLKDNAYEVFTVENDVNCTDYKMHGDDLIFKLSRSLSVANLFNNYLPKMKLASKDVPAMGIKCYTYEIDTKFEGINDTNLVMYWLPANDTDWNMPNCPRSNCRGWWVPIQTILSYPSGINETTKIIETYFDFKTTIDEPEIFQLPRGVMCKGMTSTNDFPKMSPHFSTGMEQFFPGVPNITTVKQRLYYNMPEKLVRIDFSIPPDPLLQNTTLHSREIWDYQQRVVYKFDTDTGYCKVENLTDAEQQAANTGLIRAIDYLLDETIDISKFIYVGKRTYRDMDCDVWVTNNINDDLITEIYFTNELVQDDFDVGVPEMKFVPVLLNESSVIGVMDREVNTNMKSFFNYNIRIQHWNVFDVSPCFVDIFRYRFQIELSGAYHGVIDTNKNNFIYQVQEQLAKKVYIRPIRFQEIMVDHMHPINGTTIILLTVTLLEDPFNAGHLGTNIDDTTKNDKVYTQLAELILADQMAPFFSVQSLGRTFPYRALEIRELNSIPLNGGSEMIYNMFAKLGPSEIVTGYDYRTYKLSRMACFELCVNSLGFVCETFSYCKNDGRCSLSNNHLDEVNTNNDIELEAHPSCELYTRSYLNDYVEYKNIATVGFDDEESAVSSAQNEDDCARQCSINLKNLPFYCEGFDICRSSSGEVTCNFRSRHVNEMESTDKKTSNDCSHYSRDYFGDFLKYKNSQVDIGNYVVVVVATDVKDCARLCASSADVNACQSFEMCSAENEDTRTVCRLLDASKMTDADSKLYDSKNCDHYKRERFLPGRHIPHNRTKTPSAEASTRNKYGGGDMAGIAIGLLLLGLIIGGAIVLVIMKYKVIQT